MASLVVRKHFAGLIDPAAHFDQPLEEGNVDTPQGRARADLRKQFIAMWGRDYIHAALFLHDKVIPKGMEKFEMSEHPNHKGDSNVRNFTITYPVENKGVVRSVGEWGYGKAIGIKLNAKKVIKGTFYGLTDRNSGRKIVFEDRALSVNAGKLIPNLRLVELSMAGNEVILSAKSKCFSGQRKIAWHVFQVLDTCTDIQWASDQ